MFPSPHHEYLAPIAVAEDAIPLLRRWPDLLPLLKEAPSQISKVFPGAPLHLGKDVDPECGYESLVLTVLTDLDVEAALERWDRSRDTWWRDHYQRHLHITVGFL